MILYHNTSSKHFEAIQRSGLQPRRITKRRSNWKGHIRSKLDFVYLTDAYPVYYAMNPAHRVKGKCTDTVILKVEVEESELYPDEDYLAWELSRTCGRSVEELLPEIDPADYQHHWHDSLKFNGVACTPAVAVERIVDHKIIPANNFRLLMAIGGDAMPTAMNYMFMGCHYRRCLEVLFEHGEESALDVAASYWSLGKAS